MIPVKQITAISCIVTLYFLKEEALAALLEIKSLQDLCTQSVIEVVKYALFGWTEKSYVRNRIVMSLYGHTMMTEYMKHVSTQSCEARVCIGIQNNC